ncbi:rRNA maturation RNase YbeY [Rhodothermus profundi]|uniref:Endoribonuclease YbeY n=1 Tax=Rhodothermus profundi TaxID=633813 RepID=A0A1M6TRS4_9BACT|nr:rRNA maturation RNase YbeY [Rhodothermus profundi]SHK59538.1 rRNA maturation RNase YbeY [Rhodothermus profundi]
MEELEIVYAHPSRRLPRRLIRRLVQAVLEGERVRLRYLSLVLADHAVVRELNRTYLGHDYNTDVLSFPLTETPGVVEGEIYVDLDTAAERHAEFGATFTQEACRYVVHGLLHLVGYNDAAPEDRKRMHQLEDRYLQAVGLL